MLAKSAESVSAMITKSQTPLYEEVATRIASLIDSGTLPPGSKAPSVRKLSVQFDVSIATVLAAYRLLENQRRLKPRPQSGYYVLPTPTPVFAEPNITSPQPKPTRIETDDLMMQVFRDHATRNVIQLGAALASINELPVKQVNRMMASIARAQPFASAAYDTPPGCPELRRQIARHSLNFGCALSPDDIVTTCGSQEAITLSLRAVANPGDTIAVESPAYYGILQSILALGMKALEIPTRPNTGPCIDNLTTLLDSQPVKACIFVPNFSNPLGSLMPTDKKRLLVQRLAERNIPLIEDDIYGDLSHAGDRPTTCKAFDTTGNVLLCSGFSKTVAPGLRVGWCAPGRFKNQVIKLKAYTTLATPTLPQLALARYMETGQYDHALRKIRPVFARQIARATELVAQHFPAGTKITRPQGGFVLWIELPPEVSALKLHDNALAHHIAICPGPLFSAKPAYPHHIRLNCGLQWSDRVEQAFATLGALARSSTFDGM